MDIWNEKLVKEVTASGADLSLKVVRRGVRTRPVKSRVRVCDVYDFRPRESSRDRDVVHSIRYLVLISDGMQRYYCDR